MKKIRVYITAFITAFCTLCFPVLFVDASEPEDGAFGIAKDVHRALEQTESYILSRDTNPGYGSEWLVLGMARYAPDRNQEYFHAYYNNIAAYIQKKDGKLHPVKYSEYSKLILVLTSIGVDAEDVAGYNLFDSLADFNQVIRQGLNGPIWALMALKSNPKYHIPIVQGVTVQTTENLLVQYILGGEISGGGWALMGDIPDVDMTAMVIQALSSYYGVRGYENVTNAIDRGLGVLSGLQNLETGGFQSAGVDNSESCAQVIVALTSLGIDPEGDHRFLKGENSTVKDLLTYHIENGGFIHVKKGVENGNDSESDNVNGLTMGQGFYALAAYKRFLDGKTSLYDMSDMSLKKGNRVELPEEEITTEANTKHDKDNSEAKKENLIHDSNSVEKNTKNKTSGKSTKEILTKKIAEKTTEILNETARNKEVFYGGIIQKSEKDMEKRNSSVKNGPESITGWSFVGEDYSAEETGAGREDEKDKVISVSKKRMYVIWVIAGCSVVFIAGGVFFWKKKWSGENK